MAEWQSRWLHSTKGRDVFELYKEVKENRIQGDGFLNQLITGHGTIGAHQARLFKSPLPVNVVRSLRPCPASRAAWRPSRVLRYVEGLLSRHRSSDLEAFEHVIMVVNILL
ncbi:hypothetical protein CDAR_71711 [Caerostris darwini]|uniref:Uncharacterized protein n=1 Tax=Caerostris darwini TaxID=1538125 RepID=A0AAV4TJ05_9ARAC|nr:hypothetical protein CDAR_71711 [Caerostris darwini]